MNIFKRKRMEKAFQTGKFRRLRFGKKPTPEQVEIMTQKFQQDIRNSPVWDEMVEKYGKKKAEEYLKEFKINVE